MASDVRYALRTVARNPGFAAAAILTLALGVGLNSAVFTLFNMLLFKPLPVESPERLVRIALSATTPAGPRFGNLAYADVRQFHARTDLFAAVFAYTRAPVSVSSGGQAVRVEGQIASGSMFSTLGLRMSLGRGFRSDEDAPGANDVAVISHRLWRTLLASDPAVLGTTITINGRAFSVIGVTPEGFVGPDILEPAEVWVPLAMHGTIVPDVEDPLGSGSTWLQVIARLAPGVSFERARAELSALALAIRQADPAGHGDFGLAIASCGTAPPSDREQVFPIFALVLAFTLTVLLIACANVAGLLLSRAAGRRREIGIRLALGATRGALVRQILGETLVLAASGGALGVLVGLWGTDALARLVQLPVQVPATPDVRVLLFAAAISLGAGLVFGVVPALHASRQDVLASLRGESAAPGSGTVRLQRRLVVVQLAVSLVLLAGTVLLLRGLSQAWNTDVGFEYRDRVVVSMDLRLQQYTPDRAAVFYSTLLGGVRALPGVEAATAAHLVPFGGRVYAHELRFPGRPHDPDVLPERAAVNRVWPDFFSTLEIPIVRGRPLTADDVKAVPDTAVISETMARRYWPEGDAIGQRFSVDGPDGAYVRVVGIARDVAIDEFSERPWPAAYLPHDLEPGEFVLIARSPRPAAQVISEIEAIARGLDPDLPFYASRPLSAWIAERMDGERALSQMLGICGALALFLAAMGLYGVMAYAVASRTREMGIRMALGADRAAVRFQFVGEALRLGAFGIAWGIVPSVGLNYLMRGMVLGVGAADPATLVVSAALLTGATILAAYVPARRATRIEPLEALRTE